MTVTTPAVTPVRTPVPWVIVAKLVLLQLHVPPPTPSLKVIVEPVQTLVTPEIADGTALTITDAVETQPAPSE